MTVAITGANGFVGAACVAEARAQGLAVLAVYRRTPLPEWADDPGVTPMQLDLGAPGAAAQLMQTLPEHSALIHAAAHLGDDPKALRRDTVDATRQLIAARGQRDIRLVLVSSISVYDTDRVQPHETIRESSPLLPVTDLGAARDPYAGAKRAQEHLLHDADTEDAWILRPGAIWGPTRSWHALQGFWASKLFVTIGSDGELPLTHVDHMARAAVAAARTPTAGVSVVNVLDDDRPTRARFLRAHRRCYGWPRLNVTVPYGAWLALARLLRPVAGKLPGLFREPVLRARMMPLRWSNDRQRGAFGLEDIDTFEGMMARTRDGEASQ
ncbi:NAD-dependent epimerase/dehydratase family protein [Tropicibacter naphthalenivorans]|uniref:Thioester reductase domain protein n=1 Tax=Tropicibacter naphthalenivorans TaxID=441103 RepID=A0A0P1GD34_9RHOB|nr:NAD(P)-dependent oxidoreductase [Tropicibacter naphthalenivorans]CUH79408.1 thioester reductase domain protein [Tropicibacter naphthalenivorans]SMC72037.1 Nucleoside-diphosphate-sugar epimerase [Tropicibacter naphthalenivorans]